MGVNRVVSRLNRTLGLMPVGGDEKEDDDTTTMMMVVVVIMMMITITLKACLHNLYKFKNDVQCSVICTEFVIYKYL